MNETNQGQYALLLIFISFLLVLGSLMTAFAETGLSGGAASPTGNQLYFFHFNSKRNTNPHRIPNCPYLHCAACHSRSEPQKRFLSLNPGAVRTARRLGGVLDPKWGYH